LDLKILKGISEKREKDLQKAGINSVEELIKFFPRNYLDLTKKTKLSDCYHNDIALTVCKIISMPRMLPSKRGQNYLKVLCEQDGEPFSAIWFNQPYVKNYLKCDEEYLFYGRIQNKFSGITMINPVFEKTENNLRLKGILPVYSISGKLTQKVIKDAVVSALEKIEIESIIPRELERKYSLFPLDKAYKNIHNPDNMQALTEAAKRIAVEEYFMLICSFKIFKGGRNSIRINRYTCGKEKLDNFINGFPFKLTDGQNTTLEEIYSDLMSPLKMNRLLQGDVGSGKTAVAMSAIFIAVSSGYQAAMLAPTEVLAYQNYLLLKEFFKGYEVIFLSGSTPTKEKKEIKEKLKNGKIDIICGTHAILQQDVEFHNLSMCICDEQQRFGVSQRSSLSEKGESVDILVMSATPIPRTLSLILYGDLDISTIPDKPEGRSEIKTVIVPEFKKEKMFAYIEEEVKKGRQVYFVCPKIEDDEEGSVLSVEEAYKELTSKLPSLKFELLHGRMKDKKKQEIMQGFKNKEIDCLISTTVIEVGIDVKNATIMVIFGAERFGLSQLHQLRGRVGRGNDQSYCFLLADLEAEKANERLTLFKSTSDGFKIAEYDYALRGSGDFLGTRQSGRFLSEIKNLKYTSTEIFLAKKLADETFDTVTDLSRIKKMAVKKYERLKDIVLN